MRFRQFPASHRASRCLGTPRHPRPVQHQHERWQKTVSYFSRLALIFSLLPSTENWASREASCGQTEDKHRLSDRAGAAKSSNKAAFLSSCCFIRTIFRRQRNFWTSSGWTTTTSAVALSWIVALFFFKVTTGASGTAIFSSNLCGSGYALKTCNVRRQEACGGRGTVAASMCPGRAACEEDRGEGGDGLPAGALLRSVMDLLLGCSSSRLYGR